MDRKVYKKMIYKPGKNTYWLRYGKKSLKGIAQSTQTSSKAKSPPAWFYQYLMKVKMNTV